MADTTYIVLQQNEPPAQMDWCQVGSYDAGSAEAAIRKAVDTNGTYVAVPARSWKPVQVEAVQTTTIKIT